MNITERLERSVSLDIRLVDFPGDGMGLFGAGILAFSRFGAGLFWRYSACLLDCC